jgi:Cu+-exporting ATPase
LKQSKKLDTKLLNNMSEKELQPISEDDREKVTLPIKGMHCAACVSRVEGALQKSDGVISASVNFATERASVQFDSNSTSKEALKEAIRSSGYDVAESSSDSDEDHHDHMSHGEDTAVLSQKLIISAILTSGIFFLMYSSMFNISLGLSHEVTVMIQLALATPIQFWAGYSFYTGAWHAARNKTTDMFTLIALGTSAAYFFSIYVILTGGIEVHFHTSAAIIVLILLGNLLEARAKGQASAAIKRLLGLQAKTAHVLRNGKDLDLPIEEVIVGDLIWVRPGEKAPVDGLVTEGSSHVDESMISGEAIPVAKELGDEIIGASINGTGSFQMEATRVGDETVLAQIVQLVEEAQSNKPPIAKLADKIASYFVPAVILVALTTAVVWILLGETSLGLMSAIAVLIVACPCALGLATPVSILVGTGKGAELGIFVRNGLSLETARNLSTVVMDKTGTITEGKPQVTDIIVLDRFSEDEILTIAASAEIRSEHPLGQAIVQEARTRSLTFSDVGGFFSQPGFGIGAKIDRDGDSELVLIGNQEWMKEQSINIDTGAGKIDPPTGQGKTPVYVSLGNSLVGIIFVADKPKSSSKPAIRSLKNLGLSIIMLTGDREKTARAIAQEVGIEKIIPEVLPSEKAAEIRKLQAQGENVAMIGDGINDAPALSQANLGIAIGTGTDVAIESSDITLMSGDLRGVSSAIALSKATMRNVRQNLFWAFIYNIILIPIAAVGILSPIFAGAAMAISSVSVVTNALRLKRFKAPHISGK